jgi:hypothetical protein
VGAVEVHVELRIESGAIAGSMTPAGGAPTTFVGWLGLIDAVERLQADITEDDDKQEETHG